MAFTGRAVQKLLDPTQVVNIWIKDDLQTDNMWDSMDALESIIMPMFLAVDVASS